MKLKLAPYVDQEVYLVDDSKPADPRYSTYSYVGNTHCNMCRKPIGVAHVWNEDKLAVSAALVRVWTALLRPAATNWHVVRELRTELHRYYGKTRFEQLYTKTIRRAILFVVDAHLDREKLTRLIRRELHHLNCVRYACPALLRLRNHDSPEICDDPTHMPRTPAHDVYGDPTTEEN